MPTTNSSWSSQLERTSRHLIETSTNIQAAFLDYSKRSQAEAKHNDDIIPLQDGADPINLLKRISLLESTLVKLRDECEEFARQRPIIAQEVTDLMLENFRSIEELTVLTKGKNASIDSKLRRLAMVAHEQNQAWKCSHPRISVAMSQSQSNANDLENFSNRNDAFQNNSSQNERENQHANNHNHNHNVIHANSSFTPSSFISPSKGSVIITEQQLSSIPIEKRGRSKLSRVLSVASMIYEETTARYLDGYRGRNLAIERSHLIKYAPAFPEMNNVIRDHALWRDIISSLEYLGFVRVDHSDGSLLMVDFLVSNETLDNSYE